MRNPLRHHEKFGELSQCVRSTHSENANGVREEQESKTIGSVRILACHIPNHYPTFKNSYVNLSQDRPYHVIIAQDHVRPSASPGHSFRKPKNTKTKTCVPTAGERTARLVRGKNF